MLVDTSIWVEHLRRGEPRLVELLEHGDVQCHPFVLGELALGNLERRAEILADLEALPLVPVAEHEEVLALVDSRRLHGTGIGWVDAHLLASAALARTTLWTADRVLRDAARRLGVSAAS